MTCRAVRDWLHRSAATLDEAQRLVFDDHLAQCTACRGDRDRMRLVNQVGHALVVPPRGDRAYSRAIARALLEGVTRDGETQLVRIGPGRGLGRLLAGWRLPVALGAIAAAALAIVWLARDRPTEHEVVAPRDHDRQDVVGPEDRPPAPRGVTPDEDAVADLASTPVVDDGELFTGSTPIARGAAVPANVPLRAPARAAMRTTSLYVVIAASSELFWMPDDQAIVLDRGTLDLEVGGDPTRVVTDRFEIETTDGKLTVDPSSVRVHRGTVRIVDHAQVLLAEVGAGGAWNPAELVKPAHPPRATPAVADVLATARAHAAAGDYATAEQVAGALLARRLSRGELAEVRIFLADVANGAGKLDLAIRRYDQVAARFANLPAAESAIYAAARIELRRARPAAAHARLDRYLSHYPTGRYAADARRELETQETP